MTMVENVLGTYDCQLCGSTFKITGTSEVRTAYDEWQPACPLCGFDDEVVQTDQPEGVPYPSDD